MSKDVHVDALGLLSNKGVEFKADFNGTIEDAIDELRNYEPDPYHVEELLKPVLTVRLPGRGYLRSVKIKGTDIVFSDLDSKSHFMVSLMRYCELMNIKYKLL